MIKYLEWMIYLFCIFTLSGFILYEGKKQNKILISIPVEVKKLYSEMSHSQIKLQLIDLRQNEFFEESHIPGSISLPHCDFQKASEVARSQILSYLPTILITSEEEQDLLLFCQSFFKNVRHLSGGLTAWAEKGFPEDSGEYTPPKMQGGGGCL